jgi:2-oxoglutarate dehydrogenase E1 component
MTVAMPSTPASYFHLLRWQVHSELHRPLVVFTPKSMLRNKAAVSATADFTSGYFRAVIPDETVDPAGVRVVILCSGKVYWDLLAERTNRGATDVAIVRVERLYPIPVKTLPLALAAYPASAEVRWVQEEPANQGAWPFIALNLIDHLDLVLGAAPDNADRLRRVSRPASSSPAVGSAKRHQAQQEQLVNEVFEV